MGKYTKIIDGASVADIANGEGGYNYYGYVRENGEWIIMRENTAQTEYRFARGASDYTTAWTNRASKDYKIPVKA